jgi:copper chaperone NosL
MLVSELAFAAAVREEGGEAQVYDDIICLLEDRTLPGGEHIWVHDFETLEWIDADTAVFVRSDAVSTPMGGGIVAFSDRRAAVRFADSSGGEVLDTLERLVAAVNEGASP